MKVNIIRSKRKTMTLKLDREGNAVVRAPLNVAKEEILAFVERNAGWIEKRLAAKQEQPTLILADGATLTLFGLRYTIATGRASLKNGVITLPAEKREEALIRLLKKHAAVVMSSLTELVSVRTGLNYSAVRISSARGRWGSCGAKGNISYTFRIAFLPYEIAEYIALHELCHTVHFNHSAAFWNEVSRFMPDCKNRRKEMKKKSYFMNFL